MFIHHNMERLRLGGGSARRHTSPSDRFLDFLHGRMLGTKTPRLL